MSILLDIKFDASQKYDDFHKAMPNHKVVHWQKEKSDGLDMASIRYAIVWKPDPGLLARLPNLEVIFSAGAGVDHIFEDPHLPKDKPIVRFVDGDLTTRMSEWVVLQCLMHLRQQRHYDQNQRQGQWLELPQPVAGDVRVGIMGLGELGLDAARKLKTIGFQVLGWSRSAKNIDGIRTYHGDAGRDEFLAQTDILVSLLPLTDETRGLLNRNLFEKLASNGAMKPVVINAGRGGSQVESDVVECLEENVLGGVSLDVFETEPLSTDSPLWGMENAIITPHIAAVSSIPALANYVAGQIKKHESGAKLDNLVEADRGY